VAAHRPGADPPATRALAGRRLGGRRVDHDEVDRRVVAARAAQHGAAQPRGGERPHDDHALRPPKRPPDGDPVPRVHERPPGGVRQAAQPRRPREPQRVAVERPRLGGDQRRLAGPGQAGHHDDVRGSAREQHTATVAAPPNASLGVL
jgi:hypothetical protein